MANEALDSTFLRATRCTAFLYQMFIGTADPIPPRRGGPPCPPARVGVVHANIACAVDASRSCRSRRYTLAPLAPLSSPGPRAQHPTSHRVGGLVVGFDFGGDDEFRVGADRRVHSWLADNHGMAPRFSRR